MRLAFIGDVHGRWTEADNRWFAAAGHDRVVFVGDLAGLRWSKTLEMARTIGQLEAPAIVVPGNHDASTIVQLLAEAVQRPRVGNPFGGQQGRRLQALREAIGSHELGAYSNHDVGDVTIIAARPHSMGGPTLSFAAHLGAVWDVHSLDDSTAKLRALVDAAQDRIVFVGHNGPAGLGATRSDIWGCDFKKAEGDWGDLDLQAAIAHARASGKTVLAVVAGHMHRKLRGGGDRVWKLERDGTVYVNAACVPRITRKGEHHHVEIRIEGDVVEVVDRMVVPG